MKRSLALIQLVFFFGAFLAACTGSASPAPTQTMAPSMTGLPIPAPVATLSATQSPRLPATHTSVPILTQANNFGQTETIAARLGPAQTVTSETEVRNAFLTALAYPPSPTLSPTPTFDINSIRTSTPAPAAKCPQNQSKIVPTLEYNGHFWTGAEDFIFLNYLNQFGIDAFRAADQETRDDEGHPSPHIILYRDITNDGVPEIVVSFGSLYIFGCNGGQYQILLATERSVHGTYPKIMAINDLNKNGIPELLVLIETGTQGDSYYQIIEWGNEKFNSLLSETNSYIADESGILGVLAGGAFSFRDVDGDGMKEIVLYNGSTLVADYSGSAPWRRMTKYYKWNGRKFSLSKKFFDPPQYRFQAVEDADYAVLAKTYDQALALYQRVIFDDNLEWWNSERMEYFLQKTLVWREKSWPTPASTPTPNPNEYLYLSAYARFRIMVLHLLRGYESEAQAVYQTLLDMYLPGTPGSIYANMASAFWENYQTSHSVASACGPARAVAIENEEEATRYLIDDYPYEAYPKKQYRVDQLCPFR